LTTWKGKELPRHPSYESQEASRWEGWSADAILNEKEGEVEWRLTVSKGSSRGIAATKW
jgi:hypothetical protein